MTNRQLPSVKIMEGKIVYAKKHTGKRGGVITYFVEVPEEWEHNGEDKVFKHSYMVKQFWKGTEREPKTLEVGQYVQIDGELKTEVYENDGKYTTTTYILADRPIGLI